MDKRERVEKKSTTIPPANHHHITPDWRIDWHWTYFGSHKFSLNEYYQYMNMVQISGTVREDNKLKRKV